MAHRKSSTRLAKDARVAHFLSLAAKQPALNAAQASAPVLTWEAVAALEARIVGRIVLPSSPDYNAARQESNPAFQSYPEIIVFCACENDVLECLAVARTYGVWVAVRCGGHSTAGYSVNSGMVVDLSDFQGVVLDPARERVHVLPGTDFDHFDGAMNHTGWHVPTGACGSVCVGGVCKAAVTATRRARSASRAIWWTPSVWRWPTAPSSLPARRSTPTFTGPCAAARAATLAWCCR